MPLIVGKSKESFSKNVESEMSAGKPQKQSLAIAYAMKKKAEMKKHAEGGEVTHESIDSYEGLKDDELEHLDEGGEVVEPESPEEKATLGPVERVKQPEALAVLGVVERIMKSRDHPPEEKEDHETKARREKRHKYDFVSKIMVEREKSKSKDK